MKAQHQWDEIKKQFLTEQQKITGNSAMSIKKYYNNNYALWVDLRSTEDNELHGSGTIMSNIKHGLQLELTRSTETELNMLVFVLAYEVVGMQDKRLVNTAY
jgi:plasmid maintenance system antidote protein VapI